MIRCCKSMILKCFKNNLFKSFKEKKELIKFKLTYHIEIRYGSIDIHSTPRIFFYVQKKQGFNQENSIITFEKDIFNVGDAMKSKTGIFKAPQNGTYYFSFVGIQSSDPIPLVVQLRKNNIVIGLTMGVTKGGSYTTTLTSILKLKENDTVDLYKTTGDLFDYSDSRFTHFTGWIIEEDLNMQYEIYLNLLKFYLLDF